MPEPIHTDTDVAIAQALGWHVVHDPDEQEFPFGLYTPEGELHDAALTEESAWGTARRYTSAPNAVFGSGGLLDQMRARGYYVGIMMEHPHCDPPKWTASFDEWNQEGEWIGMGATPMEAVAKAAITALRSRKETG